MRKYSLCNQRLREISLIHTQEVRGSSPCAPSIFFSDLRDTVSSNSGLLLFGHVVAEILREQALRLLLFSQTRLIVTATRVIQNCSKSRRALQGPTSSGTSELLSVSFVSSLAADQNFKPEQFNSVSPSAPLKLLLGFPSGGLDFSRLGPKSSPGLLRHAMPGIPAGQHTSCGILGSELSAVSRLAACRSG